MNPQPELESETLRSEINTTRDRMDDTIDALGNRLDGRHLVDELLGFFRGKAGDAGRVREKLSRSAETAVHSVVDTVKAHPLPVIVAGAGIAWLIYETTKSRQDSEDSNWMDDDASLSDPGFATADTGDYSGETAGYAGQTGDESGSMLSGAKEKASELTDQAREKLGQLGEQSRQTWRAAKDRVGQVTDQVQQRSREIYDRTRDRVVTTADEHPLEVGLGCLAAGFLLALALPTPDVVNRRVGPAVDRLKDRTRAAGAEAVQKGKRVVQAAANAAREEAQHQGLTAGDQPDQPAAGAQENSGQAKGSTCSTDAPQGGAKPGPSEARTTM
jgi:ElaB/YqjD/DUF883 family membrane-anchored ribosome-binding protein